MIDALGSPQSVLVLGGSSEIAIAIVRHLPKGRLNRIVLAGRPSQARTEAAQELIDHGIPSVESVDFDAKDVDTHEAVIDSVFDAGDIDVVILAFGLLGDQDQAEADPLHAVDIATTNYVGGVSSGLQVAKRLREQGHGQLVVLSSVAGDRARRSNYVYGSSKAGLDAFAQGLGDALHGSGVHVMVVRPGFVRTKMTAGLPEAPLSADADDIAAIVVKAMRKGKETVYAPAPLRFVMGGIKAVPRKLFRKLPI